MYARVIHTDSTQDWEATADFVKTVLLPGDASLQGFSGSLWLADEESNRGIAITFYATKEDLEATDQAAEAGRESAQSIAGERILSVDKYGVLVSSGIAQAIPEAN